MRGTQRDVIDNITINVKSINQSNSYENFKKYSEKQKARSLKSLHYPTLCKRNV
jgi:hypothetical protein